MLLDFAQGRLIAAAQVKLSASRQKYVMLASALDAMSPLKVLGRGYAIATDEDGAVIRKVGDVRRGDKIKIRLQKDEIDCTVD